MNQTSLSGSQHEDQHATLAFRDQEEIEKEEENFIAQIVIHARREWEIFHLAHPDVDEETFRQAQRFYVKQWFLQEGTLLSDLPAFKRAKRHFEFEVKRRVVEIQVATVMMEDPIYPAAQSLGAEIVAQARQRSQRVHDVIEELSSNKAPYLVGKIQRLRALEQAQEREEETKERMQRVRQDIENIKELGITIEYEKQKIKLKEREKEVFEQLIYVRQLIGDNRRQADAVEDSTRFKGYINDFDINIENLHLKAIDTHHVQNVAGTVPSDWDAATQRRNHAQDQVQTLGGFISKIQEGIADALEKAKIEIEHVRKLKNALERMQKRSAEIEKWADNKIIKQEEKMERAIEVARSKTKEAIGQLESAYKSLNEIRICHLRIAEKGVKFAKSLEKGKHALERAVRAAETSAKDAQDAFDQQTMAAALLDRGKDAARAQEQARQSAREEMEAYSQAKKYVEYAISYMRAISSEHIKVEETSKKLMKHFAGLLKEYLPFEQGLLDRAIAEVKNIVKVAINVIKLEENAKEAVHQTATGLETIAGANISRLIASEHEALVLAALANDDLAEYAASYQMFHKLAETVAKENLKAMLETSKEQLITALKIVEKDLDNVKKEKERRNAEHQAVARETEHDSIKLKRDLTNKLKVDSYQINLLATASALTGTLKKEELRELIDKSIDKNIDCIIHALGTNSLESIEDAFEDAKIDDIYRKYIDRYIFSSKDAEKKLKNHINWQSSIYNATKKIVYNIREYADEVLKYEYGEKEITDMTVINYIILRNVPDEMYKKRDDCLQKIAKGKGLDQLLSCVLLEDPDDDSTVTSRKPNGQEVLLEYERARAWQLAEQAQDPSDCGPSQKWTSYLTRLHRAILDEAPAFFRTQFLINQIREAVETGNLEEGTAEEPSVFQLAKELERESSASGGQGCQGENDYARAREVFRQQAMTGVQDAVKAADPFEVLSRVSFLDMVFQMIAYTETQVENVLDRTTPTVAAREVVERIGSVRGAGTKGDGMSDQRERKER